MTLKHECSSKKSRASDGYGDAITEIYYSTEKYTWIAGNDEYGTEISFCPFCGERLRAIKEHKQ